MREPLMGDGLENIWGDRVRHNRGYHLRRFLEGLWEITKYLSENSYSAYGIRRHLRYANTNSVLLRFCQTAQSMSERDGRFVARGTVN
jgi:hypothetical protein